MRKNNNNKNNDNKNNNNNNNNKNNINKSEKLISKSGKRNITNLTGKRFGHLVVLEKSDKKINSISFFSWKCKCDCGNITYVTTANLNSGHTKSCGCMNGINFIGKKFGKLTVLEKCKDYRIDNRDTYKCLCECGNITYVNSHDLLEGHTRSCGCLHKEVSAKNAIKHIKDNTYPNRLEAILNGTIPSNNKTGVTGVSKNKYGKYITSIRFQGKNYYLGTYNTLEEAKKVRKEAEDQYFRKYLDENRKNSNDKQ